MVLAVDLFRSWTYGHLLCVRYPKLLLRLVIFLIRDDLLLRFVARLFAALLGSGCVVELKLDSSLRTAPSNRC